MYRFLFLLLAIVLCFSLMGCTYNNNDPVVYKNNDERIKSMESNNIKTTIVPKENSSQDESLDSKPTPSPSLKPTPTPTPIPDDGRTQIADGFFYKPLDDEIKERITGLSYPDYPQSDITYEDLNYIKVLHYDFNGDVWTGELIVAADLAAEVTDVFYKLYQAEYPLTSIRLIDEYGGSEGDRPSMAANNTSGFNYRKVSGTDKLSNHALGRAIDINPMMNPYVKGDIISPENGAEYADRSNIRLGMIDENDLCYKLFAEYGWEWGGSWIYSKDYQHFQKK